MVQRVLLTAMVIGFLCSPVRAVADEDVMALFDEARQVDRELEAAYVKVCMGKLGRRSSVQVCTVPAGGCVPREGPRRNSYGRAGRVAEGCHRGQPSPVQTRQEAWAGHHQRTSGRRHAEGNAGFNHATGRASAREEIMKRQYLVRIDKDVDSDWGASVPDLPGCVATGKTIDAALRRIEGAIELHVRGLREDGIRVPPPRQRAVRPRRTRQQVNFYATVEVAA